MNYIDLGGIGKTTGRNAQNLVGAAQFIFTALN